MKLFCLRKREGGLKLNLLIGRLHIGMCVILESRVVVVVVGLIYEHYFVLSLDKEKKK